MASFSKRSGKKKVEKTEDPAAFAYEEQLQLIKKNLSAHNEKVEFHEASHHDLFYLQSCNIPESIIEFYRTAEPDDVVEINDARIWPVSILKLENEKMEPGKTLFPFGFFVIGTTLYGDCYCLNLNSKKKDAEVILACHDEVDAYNSIENILSSIKFVAPSFQHFLTLFSKSKLKVD
ncbi:MAG: SMI1/KNR4 family protein [Spirochaetia bacterium]|nr:SMI1/KNR4 family protein [Spirochaetia bacterium]